VDDPPGKADLRGAPLYCCSRGTGDTGGGQQSRIGGDSELDGGREVMGGQAVQWRRPLVCRARGQWHQGQRDAESGERGTGRRANPASGSEQPGPTDRATDAG
jgi:hypothetical protein